MSLSARGSRQLGDTVEKIEDRNELAQVRRQARRVRLKSLIAGVIMTLIVVFLI